MVACFSKNRSNFSNLGGIGSRIKRSLGKKLLQTQFKFKIFLLRPKYVPCAPTSAPNTPVLAARWHTSFFVKKTYSTGCF